MKYLKTLLSTLAIAAVFSAGAFAQVTQNVTVDATVEATITTSDVVGLNFGNVLAGSSPVFDASNSTGDDQVGQNATIGSFKIAASSNTPLAITFPTADVNNGQNITWTPEVAGSDANQRNGDPAVLAGNASDTEADVTTNASGEYYIFVGGSLDLTGASAGESFSETFTVTVNYF